jgi:Pyruvate/2-oxoacid:ferredoxin oxidoreductase delta subunit
MYQRLLIHYLSGTGNALAAARWFAGVAKAGGMAAELIPIDRFQRPVAPPPPGDTLVGFLFPTHGFSLPWYMLKFMLAFPRGRHHVFCLNTFAGTTLGKISLPGLSGIALILPALVLALKGYQVRGLVSLNLPSNWISLHPGLTQRAVSILVEHCRKKTDKYATALFSGRRAYRGLISLPFDLAVSPIAVAYLLVGHFWLAKMYMASSDCDGCAICANHCPMNALVMKDGRPFWTFHCESCMRCMNVCPQKAIQVSYVFAAVSAYVIYGLLLPGFVAMMLRYNETVAAVITAKSLANDLIWAWLVLSLVFLGYRLVLPLTRFTPFDVVFARFTPTSLRFWRRYLAPGIGVKDFRRKDKAK